MDIDPAWLLRIVTVIPVALILLVAAAAVSVYFFAFSLLPDSKAVVEIKGLSANVRVVRDASGIPGIIGENEGDVAQVLGYVMAQDRLWQMDYLRRAGQGRLAEILGPDYLEGDHLMRIATSGFDKAPHEAIPEREQRWLTRFVQGINEYLTTHSGKLPIEFSVLDYRPSPFSVSDLRSILRAIAWESSAALRVDPVMCRILAKLGKERALRLFPDDPAVSRDYVPSQLEGWDVKGILFDRNAEQNFSVPGLRGGCVWSAGPGRTASGKSMAACSLYQTMSAPGFWYRARLAAGDFHLSGAFIPGVPVALAGNNGHLGWGCISAAADDADLFIEQLDSNTPKNYWRIDRWRKLQKRKEIYGVKGHPDMTRTIMITRTGPLVSDVDNGRAISLKWTGRDGLGLLSALFGLNRAGSGDEAKQALKGLRAPCLNVVWAEEGGKCGIQFAGRVPIRAPESDGIIPMPAWTGVHDWSGYIPFNELPSVATTSDGVSVVADGRPGGADYPLFIGCYWSDGGKSKRIRELLNQNGDLCRDSFQRMQNDSLSPLARALTPRILAAVTPGAGTDCTEKEAIRILGSWNFRMKRDSPGAAVFQLFYHSLLDRLFSKSLGNNLYEGFTAYSPLPSRLVRKIFLKQSRQWIGKTDTNALMKTCLANAVATGEDLMGSDPKQWKWGRLHKIEFHYPLTAGSRFLESMYHVGPLGLSGCEDTVNFAAGRPWSPFRVVDAVSLKEIQDMTSPPQVFAVAPMGESAQFFSTHYKDQTLAWLNGRFSREPLETADIRKGAFSWVLYRPVPTTTVSMRK
jgi:penicillin G amidase